MCIYMFIKKFLINKIFEPPHQKTKILHKRKQMCRLALQFSAFVFTTGIVQFLYFLNRKFPASSHLLCLYSLVCVRPVQGPHCWLSHEAAHFSRAQSDIQVASNIYNTKKLQHESCFYLMIQYFGQYLVKAEQNHHMLGVNQ